MTEVVARVNHSHLLMSCPPAEFRASPSSPRMRTRKGRTLGFFADQDKRFLNPNGTLIKKAEAYKVNEKFIQHALGIFAGPCPSLAPAGPHMHHTLRKFEINMGIELPDHLGAWMAKVLPSSPSFSNTDYFSVP